MLVHPFPVSPLASFSTVKRTSSQNLGTPWEYSGIPKSMSADDFTASGSLSITGLRFASWPRSQPPTGRFQRKYAADFQAQNRGNDPFILLAWGPRYGFPARRTACLRTECFPNESFIRKKPMTYPSNRKRHASKLGSVFSVSFGEVLRGRQEGLMRQINAISLPKCH